MKQFSFDYYKYIFSSSLNYDYKIITLKDYFQNNYLDENKILINRVDVDFNLVRLRKFYEIFKELNITASIYLRLHSPDYNLLSIGNINIINDLISIGCEIGIHTELEDLKGYCNVDGRVILQNEIKLFENIFKTKIYGTASHGDKTHYNNLNFWKSYSPKDFGLIYEAYDKSLWENCRYVSDSEWTKWKAYENGTLLEGDRRTPIEHMEDDSPKNLLLLTHPESWYENYIYE